jgi:thioredoxin-like negative regulator of GroEL
MIPNYTKGPIDQTFSKIESSEDLEKIKKDASDRLIAIFFWAEWHEPCHQLKDMLEEMAKVHKRIKFSWVDADQAEVGPVLDQFGVEGVPNIVYLHPAKGGFESHSNPTPEDLTTQLDGF